MSKKHIIIDGYNFIFQNNELRFLANRSLEEARDKLLSMLAGYKNQKKISITVVFDRKQQGIIGGLNSAFSGIKVIFSNPKENADIVIRRLVENSSNKRAILVVSSDRQHIYYYVRDCGADVMSSQEFDAFLRQKPTIENTDYSGEEKPRHSTTEEIEYWMEQFTKDTN